MSDTQRTVGVDGLIEFGEYLSTLADAQCKHYNFEMPDGTGRLIESSLDKVLRCFQEFCGRRTDSFRVRITYVDYHQGTMGSSDRTFTRQR